MEVITMVNNLEKIRKAAGLTQAQLAERLNVQQSTISLIESEKRNPSIELLLEISKVLSCSLDDLIGKSA